MNCQKVRSMLSEYIDGEANDADAKLIEKHLAECASCAKEMEILLRVSNLLQDSAEVEPPPGLLERIESATVQRTGILEKLRSRIATVPQYARLTVAGLATAGILIGVLFSQMGGNLPQKRIASISEKPTPQAKVIPKQQPTITLNQPVAQEKVVSEPTYFKKQKKYATTVARKHQPKLRVEHKDIEQHKIVETNETTTAIEESPDSSLEIAEDSTDTAEGSLIATATNENTSAEEEASKIKITPPKLIVQEDPSAIEQLRAKLAAKNKQRAEVKIDPLDGKKNSVTLIGFRF